MSSHVHTSVWLSNLPSPTRTAHTDTPSAGPDGPGCQRMKGECGRKKECERKEVQQDPRTQAHPGFLYQTTTSPQEEQQAKNTPMDYLVHLFESDAVFLAAILPPCALQKTPSTSVIAAFQICNPANT